MFSNAKAAIDHIIANEGNGPQRGPPGMGGHGGGGGGGGGGFFEMIVAGHKVGLIIGKGGETIKHLQVQFTTLVLYLLVVIQHFLLMFKTSDKLV